MKRILSVTLCLLLAASLCACGSAEEEPIAMVTRSSISYSLQTTPTATPPTTLPTTDSEQPTSRPTGSTVKPTLPSISNDGETSEVGNRIAETAISLIGTPYQSGASGPDAFDNPNFVSYCYKQAGYTLPRRAAAMATFGAEAPLTSLRPGDLLLFCNDLEGDIQFVGIYIGNNQFVACNNPESPTKAQKLDKNYWLPRLVAARRVAE